MSDTMTTDGQTVCPECGRVPGNRVYYNGLCFYCFEKKQLPARPSVQIETVRTEYVLARPTDDDLRDEVAMAAMQGMLANPNRSIGDMYTGLAIESFMFADAFLAERARRREAQK